MMTPGHYNLLVNIRNTNPKPFYKRSRIQKNADKVHILLLMGISLGLFMTIILAELTAMKIRGNL